MLTETASPRHEVPYRSNIWRTRVVEISNRRAITARLTPNSFIRRISQLRSEIIPGGGTADLVPYFPSASEPPPSPPVTTPWVTYPDLYAATCKSAGGATWLQVDTLTTAGRPVVTEALGPAWGYHLDDINLALGNLVSDLDRQDRQDPSRPVTTRQDRQDRQDRRSVRSG